MTDRGRRLRPVDTEPLHFGIGFDTLFFLPSSLQSRKGFFVRRSARLGSVGAIKKGDLLKCWLFLPLPVDSANACRAVLLTSQDWLSMDNHTGAAPYISRTNVEFEQFRFKRGLNATEVASYSWVLKEIRVERKGN